MKDRRRPSTRQRRAVIATTMLIAALAVAALSISSASASVPCDEQSTLTSGTGDWDTAANWPGGVLPGPGTTVCWVPGVTMTVMAGDSAEAKAIIGTSGNAASGPLDLDGGTLTLGSSSTDESTVASLQIDTNGMYNPAPGGTLDGAGTLAVTGAFTFDGGTVGAAGAPTIISTSFTVSLTEGVDSYFDSGSISVNGPVAIDTDYFLPPTGTTGGTFAETSSAQRIVFNQGGAYPGSGDIPMTSAGGYTLTGSGVDPADFHLTQTGGTTVIPAGDYFGPGSFTLAGGTLQNDGTTNNGEFNDTGGTIDGTGDFAGSTLINTSGIVVPGDPAAPDGIGELSALGYIQLAGGTLQIPVDGTAAGDYSVLAVANGVQLDGTLALQPTATFASSATVGQQVPFMTFASDGLTGTLTTTTVSNPLQDSETFGPSYGTNQVDAVVGAAPPTAPTLTAPPVITGTTVQGDTLSTTNGTWTGSPTFTYQWEDCTTAPAATVRFAHVVPDCTAISGATNPTYALAASDVGKYITVIVTATTSPTTSADGVAKGVGPVTAPATGTTTTGTTTTTPTLAAPSGGATVHGTALPGDTLTCEPGTWTGNPAFTYAWVRNTSVIAGATASTYTVTILDEGATLTCVIVGRNSAGTKTAVAPGVVVAQKGTLTCPKPSGALSTAKVGPLALGASQRTERRALKRYQVTHYGFDNFCLYGGWGIRAGYKSGKVVLLLTANPFYKLDGVSPGIAIKSIVKRLHVGKVFPIGLNDWYIAPGHGANYVFKVRHGIIQEIGIANARDSSGSHAKQRAFLASFKAA